MRPGWIADVMVGGLALAVYTSTLSPTITWRNQGADSGDLVSAAFTLGIPHPPGYPLYTLTAAIFARLPIGDPAHNVGLFSALAAATAVIFILYSARALTVTPRQDQITQWVAPSVALVLAFTPLLWSQATIPEVYALNALLVAVLLAVLLGEARHRLALAAVVLGLGLTHHIAIALFIPSALILLADRSWKRFEWLKAGGLLVAPLVLYAYLPIRAAADPPINWGNPRTLDNFLWTVSAALYRPYLFDLTPNEIFGRAALTARFLFEQFNVWGVALGLWGMARMGTSSHLGTRRQLLALGLGFVLTSAYAIVYASRDSFLYLIPAFTIFALWIAYGLSDLVPRFASPWGRATLVGALILFPGYNLVSNFQAMDISADRTAFNYARDMFAAVPPDAVILTSGDEHLFALQYYRYVIARDSSRVAIVSLGLVAEDWYYDELGRGLPSLTPSTAVVSYGVRVQEFIDQMLHQGRPLFSTVDSPWLADYVLEGQGGSYWQVMRRR